MPAPPTPGALLVLVPYIAADGAPALRSFSHQAITDAELATEARPQPGEAVERGTSADLEALRITANEWTHAVRAGEAVYRVLRLDAFDVVIRSDGHTTTCVRPGPTADTVIVRRRPVDAMTARAAREVREHFEKSDRRARSLS